MPFFEEEDLAEARADMAAELGPQTLRIVLQRESESETGGPDLADVALKDAGGTPLQIHYRIRPLRQHRTKTEGEQTIVVADWEIKLPWEYTAKLKQGDQLKAQEAEFTVHFVDDRPDATLCRVEVLRKGPAR